MSNAVQSQINLSAGGSGQPLKVFQLDNLSIQQKSDKAYGLALAQYIESTANGGSSSYFFTRNQRWKTNRNYANGRIPMQKFVDLLQFNGKDNYININWQAINIVNRIVSGLVGRWMQRSEKIQVKAIDSLSVKDKQEEYENLEFILHNRAQLEQLEQESGIQLIPKDKTIPADTEELNLWQAQFQRLPEEILYEIGCNDVLGSCGWFDVLKDKMLHDSAETGFVGTYTWMDDDGVIHVDWVKPENALYSYSSYPDFRDTTWRGQVTSYKISELRRKYGKEFGGKLTEEELFKLAQGAKEYQLYDNITWLTNWNTTFLRPYDEWNVNIIEFELKTVDSDSYTKTVTKKNKSTILRRGRPDKIDDNDEVIDDTKWNIYRGVYAKDARIMLEWGLKKNMIRPQDPKEIGNAEFSYSFYMVQSYDMTCLAIPEKIQEPADQMIIARLKIQQLVAKMRPPGTAVNWSAVQNIDYGLGENNKSIDFKKMFDQTGDFYYHDRDAEGNPIGVPFTEIPNAGFLPQLQGLILLYDKHYQILKDELGEDPNLVSQAAQPRVAVQNIETSQQTAAYATDYFYDAYKNVMKDTARKVSCLLKTSVTYGAQAYRNIVGKNDIEGRIFTTDIRMLPNEMEVAKFEALLNQAIGTNPDLVLFVDPFQLTRVAKEDVKLAETLFRQSQKKMLLWQKQTAAENQQQIIKGQIDSAKTSEEEKRKTMEREMEVEENRTKITGLSQNQTAVVNMVSAWLKPNAEGVTGKVPPEFQPLVNAVIQNILVGAVASTEEQKKKIISEMEEAQMAQQQQQGQPAMEEQQEIQQVA